LATCIRRAATPCCATSNARWVELGLCGVLISSSHRGSYPDDDDARPFFELGDATSTCRVFIHPPAVGFARSARYLSAGFERRPGRSMRAWRCRASS